MTIEQIAELCHEANRVYQRLVPVEGIPVAPSWADFPDNQKAGVIYGVKEARGGATPEQLHESWCDFKANDGWTYGEVKDEIAKTHPSLVPYAQIPNEQKVKDSLFAAIANAVN